MCLAEKINYTSNAYYYWRRLNYFESDDLKDYTIPFKRCEEINSWIAKNNINDEKVLANLYKRAFLYIEIILGMRTISNKKDCYEQIENLISKFPQNFLCISNLSKNQIKTFLAVKKNPELIRRKILLNRFRKNLIRIRFNKREKKIVLFGKTILDILED